jgi:hypothetical protein
MEKGNHFARVFDPMKFCYSSKYILCMNINEIINLPKFSLASADVSVCPPVGVTYSPCSTRDPSFNTQHAPSPRQCGREIQSTRCHVPVNVWFLLLLRHAQYVGKTIDRFRHCSCVFCKKKSFLFLPALLHCLCLDKHGHESGRWNHG